MRFGETGRFDGEMFFPIGEADEFLAETVSDPGAWYTSMALCALKAFKGKSGAWEKAGEVTDAVIRMLREDGL